MSILHRLIAAATIAAAPLIATASPITYDFTVTATSGALAGQSSSGYFTFDSSIVPVGGGDLFAVNLLSDLSFTWDGITYDETTANTGALIFDAAGALEVFGFGNACTAGGCQVGAAGEWAIARLGPGNRIFAYAARVGGAGDASGSFTYALRAATVPEPASTALAGLALAALAATGARRRAAA